MEQGDASGTALFNSKEKKWSKKICEAIDESLLKKLPKIIAISEPDSSVIFCLPHFSSKLSSATSLLAALISSSETGVLNSSLSSNLSKSPSSVRLSLTPHEAIIESISDSTLSLRADFSDFSSVLFSSAAGSTIFKPCSLAVLVSLFFSMIFSHSSLVPAKTSFSGLSDKTTLHSFASSVKASSTGASSSSAFSSWPSGPRGSCPSVRFRRHSSRRAEWTVPL